MTTPTVQIAAAAAALTAVMTALATLTATYGVVAGLVALVFALATVGVSAPTVALLCLWQRRTRTAGSKTRGSS